MTVSKVRSCVLDVSAWTAAAIELFRCMGGNAKANSVWEVRIRSVGSTLPDAYRATRAQLLLHCHHTPARCCLTRRTAMMPPQARLESDAPGKKPGPEDPLAAKATYIRAKYAARAYVNPPPPNQTAVSAARGLEAAVHTGDAIAALQILARTPTDVVPNISACFSILESTDDATGDRS